MNRSILILAIINIVDSITSAAVTPTLTFYVTLLGGTKEQYGYVMSIGSLSSLLMMSIYGLWVDSNGNKYRTPYAYTFIFGVVGQLIYFLSILLPTTGNIAIYGLMLGKFINGCGTAGRTLSYSYIATAIPRKDQRQQLSIMTMTKTGGMILGPFVNLFIAKIDTEINFFGLIKVPLNPYNSVGLIIACGELLLFFVMFIFLEEPTPINDEKLNSKKDQRKSITSNNTSTRSSNRHSGSTNSSEESSSTISTTKIVLGILSFEILFPLFTQTVATANFKLPTVTLPPASGHALGWGPVETSTVLSMLSIVMTVGMTLAMYLSTINIPDVVMLVSGNVLMGISGCLIYVLWSDKSCNWIDFSIPVWLLFFGYPFIGPANRAKFTMAIHSKPELAEVHGLMQSMLTQCMSLSSMIAPTFIATYVLRNPDDIDVSSDKHELSLWALYVPVLSGLIVIGTLYEYFFHDKKKKKIEQGQQQDDGRGVSETSSLLSGGSFQYSNRSSTLKEVNECLSRRSEAYRRISIECEGIPNPFETNSEIDLKDKLWKEKEALELEKSTM